MSQLPAKLPGGCAALTACGLLRGLVALQGHQLGCDAGEVLAHDLQRAVGYRAFIFSRRSARILAFVARGALTVLGTICCAAASPLIGGWLVNEAYNKGWLWAPDEKPVRRAHYRRHHRRYKR